VGPEAYLRKIMALLDQLTVEDRNRVVRAIKAFYPPTPLSAAERMRLFRMRHSGEEPLRQRNADTDAKPLRPRNADRYASVTDLPSDSPPMSSDPVVPASSETTVATETTNYPEELQEIQEFLRKIDAPATFNDVKFWKRIDAWLGGDSGVFYLNELPKYLAWLHVQNGAKAHKNLQRGFRNWLAKSEFWSERRAQTEIHRTRRR